MGKIDSCARPGKPLSGLSQSVPFSEGARAAGRGVKLGRTTGKFARPTSLLAQAGQRLTFNWKDAGELVFAAAPSAIWGRMAATPECWNFLPV